MPRLVTIRPRSLVRPHRFAGVAIAGAPHPCALRRLVLTIVAIVTWPALLPAAIPAGYAGKAFEDAVAPARPQSIPGVVACAHYDQGGEGSAYHDTDAVNNGSGKLNPANGTYLNEFRMKEGVDTSYTKYRDDIDRHPFNKVQPPDGLLYVGWTEPGEWFNLTVSVAEAGPYTVDILYTAARDAEIALELNGEAVAPRIQIPSTADAAEPIRWRNWHHWDLLPAAATVPLPQGVSVLTVRIVAVGNINLATLAFRRVSADAASR